MNQDYPTEPYRCHSVEVVKAATAPAFAAAMCTDAEWGEQLQADLSVVRKEIAQLRLLSIYDTVEVSGAPRGTHKPTVLLEEISRTNGGPKPPSGAGLQKRLAIAEQRRDILEQLLTDYALATSAADAGE